MTWSMGSLPAPKFSFAMLRLPSYVDFLVFVIPDEFLVFQSMPRMETSTTTPYPSRCGWQITMRYGRAICMSVSFE